MHFTIVHVHIIGSHLPHVWQVKDLDPGNALAKKTIQRLTPIVNERREKMKDEMLGEFFPENIFFLGLLKSQHVGKVLYLTLMSDGMAMSMESNRWQLSASFFAGKLKDLGNTVLGKFGLSLENFKAEKDPNTGSYSINFKQ